MLESWFFWAVGAAALWGVAQILVKKSLYRVSPLWYNILSVPLDILLLLPFAFIFGIDFSKFTPADLLLLIFIVSNYLFYYYSLSLHDVSLSGTILSTYPVSTVIFSVIFLGERLSFLQVFLIAVIMAGVVLVGWPRERVGLRFGRWFYAAMATAILAGFADFLSKALISRVGVGNYLFFYGWAFLPGLTLAFILDRRGRSWPSLKLGELPLYLLGASLMALGVGFFFVSFSKGPASLAGPVSSLYTPLTVILAMIFLREKISRRQLLGILLSVLGVVMIGV